MVREKPSCRNERHADGRISDAPNHIVLLDANLQSRQGEAPVRIHAHERERRDRIGKRRPTRTYHGSLASGGRDKPFRSIFLRPAPTPFETAPPKHRNRLRKCGPKLRTTTRRRSLIHRKFHRLSGKPPPAEQRESAANKQRLHANDGLPLPAPPRKSFRKTDIPQSGEIRYRPPFARLALRQGKPSPPSSRFSTEDAPYPSPRRSTIAPFSGAATEDSACSEKLSAIFADIPDVPSRRNDPPLSVSGKEPRLSPEEKAPPGHRILRKTARSFRPVSRPEETEKQTATSSRSRRRIRTKPPDRNTRTRLAP